MKPLVLEKPVKNMNQIPSFTKSTCKELEDISDVVVELAPLKDAFPTLLHMFQIALTISISSASCERSFSTLKCIKTYLRTSMSEQRLTDLAILSIERDISDSLGLDTVDVFAQLQEEEKLRYKEELDLLQERRSTETARLQAELTESKQKEASGMPSLETYGSHWTATDGNQGSQPRANVWREPPPLIRCDERPPVSAQESVGVPPLARGVQEPAVMLQSDGIGRTDPSLQFSHALSSLSQLQLPPLPAFSGDDRTLENSSFKNWLEQFEMVAELAHWTEQIKLKQLALRLRGPALAFYRTRSDEQKHNYQVLVQEMSQRFTPVRIQALECSTFHERRQGRNLWIPMHKTCNAYSKRPTQVPYKEHPMHRRWAKLY